jgi:hypothetical protein
VRRLSDGLQKKQNFGLIRRSYGEPDVVDELDGEEKAQWRRFERHVRRLNEESPESMMFKVLFLGRHGQGWHNVAESKYGTPAWDVSFLS